MSVRELFEAQAARTPDRLAVVFADSSLTYGELDRRANRLAHGLLRLGVGPEARVGLHLSRSLDMVVALLGVHKAGGAYVPLDPAFPADRLRHMVCDARMTAVLSDQPERLAAACPVLPIAEALADSEESPSGRVLPENLAYVLYTSGSTGRPKGVQVSHAALVNFLLSMAVRPGLTERDVLVAVTTLSFDIAGLEIFLPLITGARLVVAPREAAMDGARLGALLASSGATALQATPVTWKLLLQAGWPQIPDLRVFCGGEALPRELARSLVEKSGEVWNLYGPTETTIWSAVARVEPGDGPVLVGRPIAATQILVLDSSLAPVPAGEAADLYIGGAGLARGYFGQPALTAERFVPHPFADRPGERLYRTGDLARFAPDGQVDFLGRSDHQVKVRGFRIELGEIESVLLEHPQVRDAVAVAAPTRSGEKRLVAYVVPREPSPDLQRELQERAAARLPEYMRPVGWAFLDALPLTPNNKVDRKALPAITVEAAPLSAGRTPTEELALGIWTDLLETGGIGLGEDFFALGGHSLLAGQVLARLRDALGIELPPGFLFEHPTPERLAAAVDERLKSGARTLPALVPVPRGDRSRPLQASYAQERLWLQEQLEPGTNTYNLGYAFRLRGPLSVAALDSALGEVFRRHEILRTRLVADGLPVPVIDPAPRLPLAFLDLSSLPEPSCDEAARRAVVAAEKAPFDLARGPVLRAALIRLDGADHLFCLAIHHIACDGWSLGVLIHEVTALYSGAALPGLPVQYADYAAWQRSWLRGELLDGQLGYWQERLAGGGPAAVLPTDHPGSRAGGGLELLRREIPREVLERLVRLGRKEGATLFMTLLAALDVLLYRYTGRERVVVGSMHANRGHSAVEGLLGFFVNVLPLQTRVEPGLPFRELLGRVRETALGAYAHQDAPYEKVVERVRSGASAGRNALFQVMVVFQNVAIPPLWLAGVDVSPYEPGESTKRAAFDLSVTFALNSGSLLIWMEYDTGLYERATVGRLLHHFERVLRDAAADPARRVSELPLREEGDREEEGKLWLTDPSGEEEEPEAVASFAAAQEKAAAIQDQVATRRSKLSEKQLALLRQRLKK